MTEKLYYRDSYTKEFYATVISCDKSEDGYIIVLDATAFFPESAGQCSDTGVIDCVRVDHTSIQNKVIYHHTKEAVEVGKKVLCRIDWEKRFRNMQNHTAEHIVSGIIHSEFGFNNVGFHLGSTDVTADFNGKLTREQLLWVEKKANQAVYDNAAVNAWFPDINDKTPYRSKMEINEGLRLVSIEGYDCSACSAPHVKSCCEIGVIKILDFEAYKGGIRLHMKSGLDALCDYNEKYHNILRISDTLSSKQEEVADSVDRLFEEYSKLKHTFKLQREASLRRFLADFKKTDDIIFFDTECDDMNELRIIADSLSEKTSKFALVVAENEGQLKFCAISKSEIDLIKISNCLRNDFSARCGGKSDIIQGTCNICLDKLKETVKNLYI